MFNTFRRLSAERPSKSASRNLFRSRSRQESSDLESSGDGLSLVSPPISHVLAANLPVTPSLTATPSTATCSTARTDPSPSPTPEPALDLKVKLMRHCVLHQGEYVRRRKGQFWKDIARVFEAETGVPIRKPGQTVENLIKERREQLRYRSGVAEADTELKQALDAFMQRFDDVEREEQDLLAKKEDMAEVKAKTKAIRRQMMLGRKRSDDDFDDDDDDDDGGGGGGSERGENSRQAVPRKKRSRLSRSDMLAMSLNSSSEALTEAISTGMQLLAGAIQPSPEEGTISFDRATELEVQVHDVDKKVSELSKQFFERISSMDEKLDRLFKKL
ncbi:hypothetical protein V1522DRAFT_414135 [Lipomyces starkeyi]